MSQKNKERIHLIYGIVLSVLIAVLGACLILSCISIYKSGDKPFTVERISTAFEKIIVPVVACIAGIIGGAIVSLALPLEDKKLAPPRLRTARLRERLASLGEECARADKAVKERRTVKAVCALLCALSAVPTILYLVDFSNFTDDINQSMISLVCLLLPCAVFAFALCVFCSFYEKRSLKKEIDALKSALAEPRAPKNETAPAPASALSDDEPKPESESEPEPESEPELKRRRKVNGTLLAQVVIFAVAIGFIVLGVANGGMSDVLEKAIKICTECVGLG